MYVIKLPFTSRRSSNLWSRSNDSRLSATARATRRRGGFCSRLLTAGRGDVLATRVGQPARLSSPFALDPQLPLPSARHSPRAARTDAPLLPCAPRLPDRDDADEQRVRGRT